MLTRAAPLAIALSLATTARADGPMTAAEREAAKREIAKLGLVAMVEASLRASAHQDAHAAKGWEEATARADAPRASVADVVGADGWTLTVQDDATDGAGVPLASVGTLGHGDGTLDADSVDGAHHLPITHVVRGPSTRAPHLPPDTVQRVVRASFGAFRICYELGLRRNPVLAGRVVLKLTIDRSGNVSRALDVGSTIGDGDVVACVVRSAGALAFPASDDGPVNVVYPLTFAPHAAAAE
jgi:hypothetical protein